jgi:hypothetical protein
MIMKGNQAWQKTRQGFSATSRGKQKTGFLPRCRIKHSLLMLMQLPTALGKPLRKSVRQWPGLKLIPTHPYIYD